MASTSSTTNAWKKIGFVAGHGNSNSPKDYSFTDNNAPKGNLQYRLKQIDFDGRVSYSDIVTVNNALAKSFKLFAPYPNPFNPSTTIKYSIPIASNVSLKIYDVIVMKLQIWSMEEKMPVNTKLNLMQRIFQVEFISQLFVVMGMCRRKSFY